MSQTTCPMPRVRSYNHRSDTRAVVSQANFETILAEVKGDKQGVKVGVLSKEKHIGDFYLAWHDALAEVWFTHLQCACGESGHACMHAST